MGNTTSVALTAYLEVKVKEIKKETVSLRCGNGHSVAPWSPLPSFCSRCGSEISPQKEIVDYTPDGRFDLLDDAFLEGVMYVATPAAMDGKGTIIYVSDVLEKKAYFTCGYDDGFVVQVTDKMISEELSLFMQEHDEIIGRISSLDAVLSAEVKFGFVVIEEY